MRPPMRTRGDEHGVVVPSRLMLVAIVVIAIAAVMYAATSPGHDSASADGSGSTAVPSKQTTKPLGTATPTASPSGSTSASSSPSATPSKKPVTVKRQTTYVQVFNNSGRTGLASRTASKASGVGWKVVGSDNWYGTVPASTVYFPAKLKAAAQVLARDLGIRRLMPSVSPMRNDRLTVILTDDYRA